MLKNTEDTILCEGDVTSSLLALTKPTLDRILNYGAVESLKKDSKTGEKSTVEIQGDMIALYVFYAYTAKWQDTYRIKCTTGYAAKGLKWGRHRLIRAKKALMDLQLIYDETSATGPDGEGSVRHYIRFRYYINNKRPPCEISHTPPCDISQCEISHTNSPEIIDKCSRDNTIANGSYRGKPNPAATHNSANETEIFADSFFPLSPSRQVTAPQVTHSAPPPLPQMLERILRLKAGRDSRGETRKLKPVRDRSETTSWKRIEKFVTEDEVELIEWFYSAPKSKSFDETWNRKTTPATIMNNWTNQLEKAEAYRESRPSSNPIGHIGTPQNWREGVERMLAKPGQSEKTQNIFGAMLQKEDNELNQEEKEMLKQWREMGDI